MTDHTPIRAVVVDDEPLARDCVRLALGDAPDVEIVAECGDGERAVTVIREHDPDLVFLDVQMPGLDGFDVIEKVGLERMPAVVFVTAYDAHALRAFEVHAVDYLLKPFDDRRFHAVLAHARTQLRQAEDSRLARRLAAVLEDRRLGGGAGGEGRPVGSANRAMRFTVRRDDRIRFVSAEDVDYIEADGNYVRLHAGQVSHRIRATLSGVLDRLDAHTFVRIHRSTIVNVNRIKEVQPWFGGDYIAILHDGRKLRVSRSFRDGLLKPLG